MAIGFCGIAMFNVPVRLFPDMPFAPPIMVLGLIVTLLSSFLPWAPGNRARLEEDAAYRQSLEPKQPWE